MRNYYIAIEFKYKDLMNPIHNDESIYVDHIFYNQPDKTSEELANYWMGYIVILLSDLYNSKTFEPVLKDDKFDIYSLPSLKKEERVDRHNRSYSNEAEEYAMEKLLIREHKKEIQFVTSHEDLVEMRNSIPDFKEIDEHFKGK